MAVESNKVWFENMFLRITTCIQTVIFRRYYTAKLIVLITRKAKAIK